MDRNDSRMNNRMSTLRRQRLVRRMMAGHATAWGEERQRASIGSERDQIALSRPLCWAVARKRGCIHAAPLDLRYVPTDGAGTTMRASTNLAQPVPDDADER